MTSRSQDVRVLLYGCSHRPRWSSFSCPIKGDQIICRLCNRPRRVIGIQTTWAMATAKCRSCKWHIASDGMGKRRLLAVAQRHANATDHQVSVWNDGYETRVKSPKCYQPSLIDDLLLPD